MTDHSMLMNEWSCTSITPCGFMACTGTHLSYEIWPVMSKVPNFGRYQDMQEFVWIKCKYKQFVVAWYVTVIVYELCSCTGVNLCLSSCIKAVKDAK